jgi:TldD protein
MTPQIDSDFRSLPFGAIADAALQTARAAGASHADVRVQRGRHAYTSLRDARPVTDADGVDSGLAVRVLLDGVWGFAAVDDPTPEAAAATCERALAVSRMSRPLAARRVELADEPVHAGAEWVSPYAVDPFGVPAADRVGLLAQWSQELLAADAVDHVDASLRMLKEQKFYADLAGTTTLQQRVMVDPEITVVAIGEEGPETMRSIAPPRQLGWEYLTGDGHDWTAELAQLPGLVAERLAAPSVEPGELDLVVHPSNLWLTIHESVGHATELDRALGYEAAYAGTSFATLDKLGTFRYGSELMNVTGDRTAAGGGATIGYDDEGVATREWDIIRDGVLVGYQLDRAMAAATGLGTSNGCAYADSALRVPVQRMANVSLQPAPDGPDLEGLIGGVTDGLYAVGDNSWSIDMQRYNFQFTAQRFYRIRNGRLAGQVKDAAYQGSTPSFWGSMVAVGGPGTYLLHGAPNCGKAQPGQTAWVGHGAPAAVFSGVRILNTRQEGQR